MKRHIAPPSTSVFHPRSLFVPDIYPHASYLRFRLLVRARLQECPGYVSIVQHDSSVQRPAPILPSQPAAVRQLHTSYSLMKSITLACSAPPSTLPTCWPSPHLWPPCPRLPPAATLTCPGDLR
eukprot:1064945-Rhodomonas_salina.1